MKKFLALLSFLLFIVSCEDIEHFIDANLDTIEIRWRESFERLDVVSFDYKEHSYLLFKGHGNSGTYNGVVHDPNCQKCKESKEITVKESSLFDYVH